MKKETNLKTLLGLSQEEAAILLGVSRVQWAHFTDGRRDIPAAAKVKLAEVLSSIEENKKNTDEVTKLIETEKKKAHEELLQEYKAIPFKELELDKKIKKSIQLREEAFKALQVVHYLEAKKNTGLSKFIKTRVTNTLKKHSLGQIQELELKKESLQMLKILIEKKLKV